MKIIFTLLFVYILFGCGPRTGIHEENDIPDPIKIEYCIVKSIKLSYGKYQDFIVCVSTKDGLLYNINTKMINFNIDDSVIVVNRNVIRKINK